MYDVLVVGGGVNGTGIAMDAAGRGLRVALCEMNDLASATSSKSSKLIHGGLRYLEHYEFSLVREALSERETLLKNAPHIMWPLRFVLPHMPHLRPAWMIRAGLFLYDHLAKREMLAGSEGLNFTSDSPLKPAISKGFAYSDGWVDDARLVLCCAQAAAERGADIMTRTKVVSIQRHADCWEIGLLDIPTGQRTNVHSKALVNAAGPWVSALFQECMQIKAPKQIRLVKGSHIVVPKIHDQEEAYILQNEDGRIVFVIPYEDDFSLVGTTDVDYQGDPNTAEISEDEIEYLLHVVNQHFIAQIDRRNIVWHFSGVRPLMDDERGDAAKASRDYAFDIDATNNQPPLLSVFGGKITTYRKLAEAATNAICKFFPETKGPWTKYAKLPGGDLSADEVKQSLHTEYPWLPHSVRSRFVRTYGSRAFWLLGNATCIKDLGEDFGAGLYAQEVDYLIEYEWVMDICDVIWRRTKLGLRLNPSQQRRLAEYIQQKRDSQRKIA